MITAAAEIAALRLQLIDAGWRPVPASPLDKSCHVMGWPTIEPNDFHVENWSRTHSAHTLTSIVCGQHIVALDLDVLDAERADQVQAAAFRHLGVTGFIRVGRAPKRLLVYRQPYTAPLPNRQNGHAAPASPGSHDGGKSVNTRKNLAVSRQVWHGLPRGCQS